MIDWLGELLVKKLIEWLIVRLSNHLSRTFCHYRVNARDSHRIFRVYYESVSEISSSRLNFEKNEAKIQAWTSNCKEATVKNLIFNALFPQFEIILIELNVHKNIIKSVLSLNDFEIPYYKFEVKILKIKMGDPIWWGQWK